MSDINKQREAFEREERYIVIKLKNLDSRQRDLIDMVIDGAEITTTECVVVESDWPNYEHTWDTVRQVAQGEWDSGQWKWQAAQHPAQADPDFDAWVLFDPKTNKIKMHPETGALAIFEEERHAKAAKHQHPGTEYKQAAWYRRPQPPKAVPDGYTPVRTQVLLWLLGESGVFEPPQWQRDEHERTYGRVGSFWWRTHLRRAMLDHPGPSTTAFDDQHRGEP